MPQATYAAPLPWYRKVLDLILGCTALGLAAYIGFGVVTALTAKADEPKIVVTDAPHVTPDGTTYVGENWRATAVDGAGSRAQRLLDETGKVQAHVMFVDAPCGNMPEEGFVNGCVDKTEPTTIYLANPASTNQLDDTTLRALVMHEASHVKQLQYSTDFLSSNPSVIALFPGSDYPSEPLADCMTEAVLGYQLHTYISECSPEQLSLAASVWQ